MKIKLHTAIFIGMLAGVLYGFLLPQFVEPIRFIGTLFIQLLKLMVVPLIFVSLVDGIARVGDMSRLSSLGFKTTAYYLATNVLAVVVSLVVVNLVQPGVGVSIFGMTNDLPQNTFSLLEIIPKNIFASFAQANTIQIVFIAIFFGVGLVMTHDRTTGIRGLFSEANEWIMKLTELIIKLAPIGVFALMAGMVEQLDWSAIQGVLKFAFVIVVCLLIHAGISLVFIFKAFSNRSLKDFLKSAEPALLSAFSTSSSSATLPITMRCMVEDAKVSRDKAGFVLPIGATVNMDGTAMYEAIACLFVAQAVGVELSLVQQIIVFATASLAAMGAAAIPSAGLITLTMVLTAVNLPLEGIGFLLAIDRIFDMSRTTVNVWGDMVGCAVVEGKTKSSE